MVLGPCPGVNNNRDHGRNRVGGQVRGAFGVPAVINAQNSPMLARDNCITILNFAKIRARKNGNTG